jgi:hypothetical protein
MLGVGVLVVDLLAVGTLVVDCLVQAKLTRERRLDRQYHGEGGFKSDRPDPAAEQRRLANQIRSPTEEEQWACVYLSPQTFSVHFFHGAIAKSVLSRVDSGMFRCRDLRCLFKGCYSHVGAGIHTWMSSHDDALAALFM